MDIGYFNGEIGPLETMRVPMNDRAVCFGDGVYEVTYSGSGRLYALKAHMERFVNSCRLMRLPLPMPAEEIEKELQRCVTLSGITGQALLYWQCTRGTAMRQHAFPENTPSNLMITVREKGWTSVREPGKAILIEDVRFRLCHIKTLNLIPNVLASEQAKEAGCDEAIFHRGERVTEGAHTTVSLLKDGTFITPPLDELILPGTTRRRLLELCPALGIPAEVRPFTVDELFTADEVFHTSAGLPGLRLCSIDGRPVGGRDGETMLRLQRTLCADFTAETGMALDLTL